MTKPDYILSIPSSDEVDFLEEMIQEHNSLSIPFDQEEPFIKISRCVKDEDGKVIGGIVAYSVMWHILYIDTLWVDKPLRNSGIGSILLRDVEKEAIEMGCHLSHLSTFDFQGKDFYIKNGYSIFGTLDDSPKGHKEFFLSKRL